MDRRRILLAVLALLVWLYLMVVYWMVRSSRDAELRLGSAAVGLRTSRHRVLVDGARPPWDDNIDDKSDALSPPASAPAPPPPPPPPPPQQLRSRLSDSAELMTSNATKLRVLVYKTGLSASEQRGARGGPMGEVILFRSLLAALADSHAHATVTLLESLDALQARWATAEALDAAIDLVVTDQYAFRDLQAHGHFSLSRCKYRMLDFWGTPPVQNHEALDLAQFLVPYANPWNTWMGFIVEPPAAETVRARERNPRAVVLWGKESRYFVPATVRALAALDGFEFHYTLPAELPAELTAGPARFTRHGVLSRDEWYRLLWESQALVGLGDPVLGPSALDALACGAIYVNPINRPARRITDNVHWPLNSQHPAAAELYGPLAVIDFDPAAAGALARALADAASRETTPRVHARYTRAAFTRELLVNLRRDFCLRPAAAS